jgi:hypothetical protein
MPLKAFEDIAAGPLVFPIGGKTYTAAPVGWVEGLRLTEIAGGAEMTDSDEERRLLLGDTYAEMVADNVPALALSRAIFTALTDFRLGRPTAERVWESGLTPEALAPEQGATTTQTQPTVTASASETPSPASTRTTSSQRASSKKRAVKASRSPKPSTSGD